ncbi:hypothetical protein ParaMal1_00021 [Paracoccus phage ParMal1]|uniref:Uncharacterized protein n=1 Tax=Paracoccus phage ParMal1 TaxID=3032416 RepID=A0AAF0FE99_9CAUD|nr:hypothetical protein ParaMal1_00021 [Paracoccus phage ParMal1]
MSIANTETALFVSMTKAIEFCHAACSRADVREATPHRRYSRGALLGYWINLKMTDGTLQEMSEDYAEGLAR